MNLVTTHLPTSQTQTLINWRQCSLLPSRTLVDRDQHGSPPWIDIAGGHSPTSCAIERAARAIASNEKRARKQRVIKNSFLTLTGQRRERRERPLEPSVSQPDSERWVTFCFCPLSFFCPLRDAFISATP